MTPYQFWHEDIRLFSIYQKAYYRNVSYSAWVQGSYNFEAYSKALHNSNRTKKSDPFLQFDEWKDPMLRFEKPKVDKNNLENEFRNSQAQQNLWLKNILNN